MVDLDSPLCDHIPVERLEAFERGDLSDDSSAALEAHLDGCDVCCAALAGLPGDDFVNRLRAAHATAPQTDRSLLPTLLQDTQSAPPQAAQDRPTLPGFEDLRELGRGGMGVVYAATHAVMGRRVAVKVITAEFTRQPAALDRFRREARAAARLSHPNLVSAYDAGQEGEQPFLVMELIDGESLAERLRRDGPLPVEEACNCVRQAALGLQHAHDHGLVHRDIKPHNLMRAADGTVKVLDFGLAALADDGCSAGQTGPNAALGTPDYMAPEQAEDARRADGRADVYGLGCTLYHLLTGAVPFPEDSTLLKLWAHRTQPPPSARAARPDVPPRLDAVLRKAMAKRPEDRYQTPGEFAGALAADPVRDARSARRQRCRTLLGMAAVVCLTGATVAGVLRLSAPAGRETAIVDVRPEEPAVDDKVGEVRSFAGQLGVLGRVHFLPDGDLAVATGNALSVWNVRTGKKVREMAAGGDWSGLTTAVSRDGRRALIGTHLWDLETGTELRTLQGVNGRLLSVAFAPDGRHAVVGSELSEMGQFAVMDNGTTLFVMDLETGKRAGAPRAPEEFWGTCDAIHAVAYSPDGTRLAAGQAPPPVPAKPNGTLVRVYDADKCTVIASFPTPTVANCVAFSPDGKHLLAAVDKMLLLWDLESGKELKRFEGHGSRVEWAAFTPDGRRIVSGGGGASDGGGDNTVRVWDVESGKEVHGFKGHTLGVLGVSVSPDGRYALSGGRDGMLRLWRLPDIAPLEQVGEVRRWTGHTGPVLGIAVYPDNHYAFSVGNDLRKWELPAGRPVRSYVMPGLDGGILSPDAHALLAGGGASVKVGEYWFFEQVFEARLHQAFVGDHLPASWQGSWSRDGRHFLSAGDQTARLWDIESGKVVREFAGHEATVRCVDLRGDGMLALTGSEDGVVRVWDRETEKERYRLAGQLNQPNAARFTPDGRGVLSCGRDGVIRLFDVYTKEERRVFGSARKDVTQDQTCFLPGGRFFLSVASDRVLRLWEFATGKGVYRADLPAVVVSLAVTRDGRYALLGTDGGEIIQWRLPETARLSSFPEVPQVQYGSELRRFMHKDRVPFALFLPDGRVLSAGEHLDRALRLWDVTTGAEVGKLEGPERGCTGLVLLPGGKQALSTDYDGVCRVWDLAEKREVRRFTQDRWIQGLAVSNDGRYVLASGDGKRKDRLLNLETGAEVRDFARPDVVDTAPCLSSRRAAFSPDDRFAATAGWEDGSISLWDVETGRERKRLTGHTGGAEQTVVFLPDGKRLLSSGEDGLARLWDVDSGEQLCQFEGHRGQLPVPVVTPDGRIVEKRPTYRGPVAAAAVSPDGRLVLTGGNDGTVRLWDVETGRELHRFWEHADFVLHVAFAPDGKTVLSTSKDWSVRIWRVPATLLPDTGGKR